ncbi:MAG: threonylcarbamoyl-AMP synthase [Puniceicoccales bacterium]|jgi:L-threonylcarbamoyladenylate synthase|nr:threonylcarbamoyl-AMP synthase [Puniceicoccales bacterium]
MNADIVAASRELKGGGVVVLPTETVYGLAANALDGEAVRKIFTIKGRPLNNPLILHVLDSSWLERYSHVKKYSIRIEKITGAFWPGPITVVLPKKAIIPDIVTSGSSRVAIRCPDHPIFQAVLRTSDLPLAAPSANPFGYVSPTCIGQVKATLGDRVKIMLDGGECAIGLESTILDITSPVPRILRPGAITADAISEVLGEDIIDHDVQIVSENPSAPGQLKQHYCTDTRLVLFEHGSRELSQYFAGKTAIVFMQRPKNFDGIAKKLQLPAEAIFWFSDDGNLNVVARNLFSTLQRLDSAHYNAILCERPPRAGIGIAIDDRLLRAAAKFKQ